MTGFNADSAGPVGTGASEPALLVSAADTPVRVAALVCAGGLFIVTFLGWREIII